MLLHPDDPVAAAATDAIRCGEVDALRSLLGREPGLATARIEGGGGTERTLLHVATDWPGHHPNGVETVQALVEAGADVDAALVGPHRETALHWAVSNDDVEVVDALLDAGADIEALGSVVGGGTPLADAVAFGQWQAAQVLIGRGAKAELWQAAALGLMDRVEACFAGVTPARVDVTNSFWCACHGGQLAPADFLLARGADLDWVGYDNLTPLDAARRRGAEDVVDWLRQHGAKSATRGR